MLALGTSRNPQPALPLDPYCISELTQWLQQKTGIVIQPHQLDNLRGTIHQACERFRLTDCRHYLAEIRGSARQRLLEEHLIGAITVGESYFFRDPGQFKLLETKLIPELLQRKRAAGNYYLRIWSAGCSMGQEIYSIAMLLDSLLPTQEGRHWRLHLLGTDINTDSLSSASRGRFGKWSMRAMPPGLLDRYFNAVGEEYQLSADIVGQTRFAYLNLVDDDYPSILTETNALDLILCRNVFIYLAQDSIQRVMARFEACLSPDGVLLLGPSDIPQHEQAALQFRQHQGQIYYRKQEQQPPSVASAAFSPAPAHRPSTTLAATRKVRKPTLRHPAAGSASPPAREPSLVPLAELLQQGKWDLLLRQVEQCLCEQGESAQLLQYKAKALANLGDLAGARGCCEASMRIDPMDKHGHLLHSLILLESDDETAAEAALRKVIYLDIKMAEAHYHLALLRLRRGDTSAGLKGLEKALAIAEAKPPEEPVHDAQGMTQQRFGQIIRQELAVFRATRNAASRAPGQQ